MTRLEKAAPACRIDVARLPIIGAGLGGALPWSASAVVDGRVIETRLSSTAESALYDLAHALLVGPRGGEAVTDLDVAAQTRAAAAAADAFLAARNQPKETAMPTETPHHLRLADTPSTVLVVLVDLVDHGPAALPRLVNLAPEDATNPRATTIGALLLLVQMGCAEVDTDREAWAATDPGRALVAAHRAYEAAEATR